MQQGQSWGYNPKDGETDGKEKAERIEVFIRISDVQHACILYLMASYHQDSSNCLEGTLANHWIWKMSLLRFVHSMMLFRPATASKELLYRTTSTPTA